MKLFDTLTERWSVTDLSDMCNSSRGVRAFFITDLSESVRKYQNTGIQMGDHVKPKVTIL